MPQGGQASASLLALFRYSYYNHRVCASGHWYQIKHVDEIDNKSIWQRIRLDPHAPVSLPGKAATCTESGLTAGEPLLSQKWFPRTPSENQFWMFHEEIKPCWMPVKQ